MIPDWAKELNCSITVCDKDGVIVYQNDRAVEQYRKRGDLIGRNLFDCHNEKNGVHKMIFQSAWKENGFVAGLCEISMIIPAELPHHVR